MLLTQLYFNYNIKSIKKELMMDIQTITNEIKQKLTHAVNTKSPSYAKTISSLPEQEQESKMSTFITDLTFEISEKVVKDKIRKMNPKPISFTFYINRAKYFEQTLNELVSQLKDDVYFEEKDLAEALAHQNTLTPFIIEFTGHFLKDYGYIGKKTSQHNELIRQEWFTSILKCVKMKDYENIENAEETLNTLKEFITIGFEKAINQEYVFVDNLKIEESLRTLDYVIFEDNKLSPDEFNSFRKSISIGNRN